MTRIKIDDLTPTRHLSAQQMSQTVGGHGGHGHLRPGLLKLLLRAGFRRKVRRKVSARA